MNDMEKTKQADLSALSVGQVHINQDGQPLCKQTGQYLRLCDRADFPRIPAQVQCHRCRRLAGLTEPWEQIESLSIQQKNILREIRKRDEAKDDWCAVAELCENKTSSGWTSLHRSIRGLVKRGLIEKRTDRHNRAWVRLKRLER